jgi:DNA repair protein RadC
MPDYEVLEMVLFRALRRQDVKPLARRLIDTFGDLSGVLAASPARLRAVEGVGAAVVTDEPDRVYRRRFSSYSAARVTGIMLS